MQISKSFVCPDCEGIIEETSGQYFCSKCGKKYFATFDCEGNEVLEPILPKYEGEQSESIKKKETKTMLFATTICALIICVVVIHGVFTSSDNGSNNDVVQNNYESSGSSNSGVNNHSSYEESVQEPNSSLQSDIKETNDDSFGVTVDEVARSYNRVLAENNPDASQGDIDVCSLKDYTLNTRFADGRSITIYTYLHEGTGKYRGANIIEDSNSHKVIYVDLFSHNDFFAEEKLMRIFQEQYYCLAAAVDNSIGISKFNEIWEEMSQNSDFSTVYNGKKFFCMSKGEATYLGITLP